MPIAIDPSTPARVSQATSASAVTASFTPPDNSILVCTLTGNDAGGAANTSVTNSGTALTWNLVQMRNRGDSGGQAGVASMYWALLATSRALTVTGSTSSLGISNKVLVLTGVDLLSPLGGNAEGSSTATSSFSTTGFTIARDNSLGIVVASQWTSARGIPTSSDTTGEGGAPGGFCGYTGTKALGAAGGSATFNLNGNGSPSTINWVTAEFQASLAASPLFDLARRRTHMTLLGR